jgi:hypothetical protein
LTFFYLGFLRKWKSRNRQRVTMPQQAEDAAQPPDAPERDAG